jgi:PPOX class probable F420-dependent enzyme
MRKSSIAQANYLCLSTFRRTGEEVHTPVWFAELDNVYYIFSAGKSGKIKRIRNSPKSRVAPCTATGKITGDWLNASAFILGDEDHTLALKALHQKYGLLMRLTDWLSKITGKYQLRAFIAITLT